MTVIPDRLDGPEDAPPAPLPFFTQLHEWVVTVDHKRLGIMYVGEGLYGAGSAPDVGWFAYSPLTGRAFSPGQSTDYWHLALLVSGVGTIATSINLIASILTMRCPGMTLGRMPLYVWMILVVSAMTLLILPPLSAAQIMLLFDCFLGAHFFDTQAGGSAILSVGCLDPRVGDDVPTAAIQLRRHSRGSKSAAFVGPQASRRPGLVG